MSDFYDFQELMADVMNISDQDITLDGYIVENEMYNRFNMTLEDGYALAKALLPHTVPIEAGLSHKYYNAFVSRNSPLMLMKELYVEPNMGIEE